MKIREKKKHKNLQFRLRFSRPFHFLGYLSSKKKKSVNYSSLEDVRKKGSSESIAKKEYQQHRFSPERFLFLEILRGNLLPREKIPFSIVARLLSSYKNFFFFSFSFSFFFCPLIFHFPFETQPDFQLTSLLSAKSRLDFPIL